MDEFEITAGKKKTRQGDTGVRGSLALQFVGVTKSKAGLMVGKIKLDTFKYDVVQEEHPVSGLNVPVVYLKARKVDAQEGDDGAVFEDGKWVVQLQRKKVEPDYPDAMDLETRYKRIMDTEIYFQCKVIWPESFHGQVVPLSTSIKGIEFPHGPEQLSLNFITDDQYVPKLMKLCMAFGFDPGYFNSDSPIYDPEYLKPYIYDLETPLSESMVVERLLVPILIRHGQQGHLARGETSENSHFIVAGSVKGMGEKEAAKIWEQAAAWGQAELIQEEPQELAPFPGEETAEAEADPEQAKTGEEAERLRAKVRSLAAGNDNFAWDVSEFLDSEGIPYSDENLLASLNVDNLKKIVAHFTPKAERKRSL